MCEKSQPVPLTPCHNIENVITKSDELCLDCWMKEEDEKERERRKKDPGFVEFPSFRTLPY